MKILIVEDDVTTRKVLCNVLSQREGYEPVAVASAEEAQALYLESFFSLIILDLNLPRMNGIDFSKWVRQQPTGDLTYILVGTAHAVDAQGISLLKQMLEAGADDYIAKPYHPSLLGVRLAVAEKQISLLKQRKHLSEALKKETDFVSAVIEAMTVLVVVLDVNMNIVRTNPAFRNLTDLRTNYALDFQRELLAPDVFPEVMAGLQGQATADKPISFLTTLTTEADGERLISWTLSIVPADVSMEARFICSGIDITDRQAAEERLGFLALRDPLTSCYNRNYLASALSDAFQKVGEGASCVLLSIDLDNFKIVNDSAGHLAGDRLLISIVDLFRRSIVTGDEIIRMGGDEFVIILNSIRVDDAKKVAERICQRVEELVFVDGEKHFSVSVSIGLAPFDLTATGEQMISRADSACYAVKAHGRNGVVVYDSTHTQSQRLQGDINWRDRIRRALQQDDFELWQQPVIDTQTGEAAFHEILLRLKGADGEIIMPSRFMPAAERFRLMPRIDRYVIERVGRLLAQDPGLRVSINLSAHSLMEPQLAEFILRTLPPDTGMASRVCFEILETTVISDMKRAEEVLQQLSREGFQFALDDFGVGFSSFDYLKRLPIKYLKIDGGFIVDLVTEPINRAFIKAMSQIARDLNVLTVAECVETEEILAEVRALQIDFAQGYHIGRPAPFPAKKI